MKKVFKILTLIMLIVTLIKIGDTYAKYYSEAQADATQSVGKWVIKLNGEDDIYTEDGYKVEFITETVDAEEPANTTPGKIAPGTQRYADIMIDPTGTDVAVRYDVDLTFEEIENVELAVSVGVENEGKQLTRTGEYTYTGIIGLEQIQQSQIEQVRCYITWTNNDDKNEFDSTLGSIEGNELEIPVKITVTQYLGETFTEYTE